MEAIGIAIAVVSVAGALTAAFLKALAESKGRREEAVARATADALATSLSTQLTDSTKREQEQRDRADRLSARHSKLLAEVARMPATGSYRRLLEVMSAEDPNGGDGAGTVHQGTGTSAGLDTRLLRPGDEL